MSINATPHGNPSQDQRPFTIVLFGRRCTQTIITLRRMLHEDLTVAAVLVPSQRDFGPTVRLVPTKQVLPIATRDAIAGAETLDQIANKNGTPLYDVRRPIAGDVRDLVAECSPDLIVVSCFPWRIPDRISRLATSGAVNVHPSMLPNFRGPDPLFWALKTGAMTWGVTVHRLTSRLDAGPILRQREFAVTPNVIERGLETVASEVGAEALVDAINDIRAGSARPIKQDETQASHHEYPNEADLEIRSDWTVQRALNFARGVIQLGYEPIVVTDRGPLIVRDARPASKHRLAADAEGHVPERIVVQFRDGSVEFQVGQLSR